MPNQPLENRSEADRLFERLDSLGEGYFWKSMIPGFASYFEYALDRVMKKTGQKRPGVMDWTIAVGGDLIKFGVYSWVISSFAKSVAQSWYN